MAPYVRAADAFTQYKLRLGKELESIQSTLSRDPNGTVYRPRIPSAVVGTDYANIRFADLPASLRKEIENWAARVSRDASIPSVAAIQVRTIPVHLRNLTPYPVDEPNSPEVKAIVSAASDFNQNRAPRIVGTTGVPDNRAGFFRRFLSGLPRNSGLVAAGVIAPAAVGAGAFADVTLGSSTPACGNSAAQWTNQDPAIGCQDRLEINPSVARFLALPEEEQLRQMQGNPRICSFYNRLHERLLRQPDFLELDCRLSPERISQGYKIRTRQGRTYYSYDVTLDPGSGAVRSVMIRQSSSQNGSERDYRAIRFVGNSGIPTGDVLSNASTFAEYRLLRLFLPDANECCSATGSFREQCLAGFRASPSGESQGSRGAQ